MTYELIPAIVIFLFGTVIGSFLNVCIFRIPLGQEVVKTPSHCMTCGYQLKWYDNIPIISYLCLRGRCRKCRTRIPVQYPVVESVNGILYMTVFLICGWDISTILYCLLGSALIVLGVIDFRTYEIPSGINVFILVLGLIRLFTDRANWSLYVIGFLAVSVVLYIILVASDGKAVGGGDVKLMGAAGLLLGWKLIIFAFLLGCILGSVIHLIRMKKSGAGHVLAMGPYLAMGIMIAALWGNTWIEWYLSSFY
mgnify:CR=1 FL=1